PAAPRPERAGGTGGRGSRGPPGPGNRGLDALPPASQYGLKISPLDQECGDGSVPSGFEAVDDAIRAGADGAFSFLERLGGAAGTGGGGGAAPRHRAGDAG